MTTWTFILEKGIINWNKKPAFKNKSKKVQYLQAPYL